MAHTIAFQNGQKFCVACGTSDGSGPCPHSIGTEMLTEMLAIEKSKADSEARKADSEARKADTEARKADTEARKADTEARKADLFKWSILCGNYYIIGVSYKGNLNLNKLLFDTGYVFILIFLLVIYVGFDRIQMAIGKSSLSLQLELQRVMKECNKGGWLAALKHLFFRRKRS